jgi:hypothetical protein
MGQFINICRHKLYAFLNIFTIAYVSNLYVKLKGFMQIESDTKIIYHNGMVRK